VLGEVCVTVGFVRIVALKTGKDLDRLRNGQGQETNEGPDSLAHVYVVVCSSCVEVRLVNTDGISSSIRPTVTVGYLQASGLYRKADRRKGKDNVLRSWELEIQNERRLVESIQVVIYSLTHRNCPIALLID
jgi:hypothetical protein